MSEIRNILNELLASVEVVADGKLSISVDDIDQAEKRIQELMLTKSEIKTVIAKVMINSEPLVFIDVEKIAKALVKAREDKSNGHK